MKLLSLNPLLLAAVLGCACTAAQAQDQNTNNNNPGSGSDMAEPVQINPEDVQNIVESVVSGMNTNQDNTPPGQGQPSESFSKRGVVPPRSIAPKGTNAAGAATTFDFAAFPTNSTPPDKVVKEGEKGIWLNFRNAPLDLVLSHLSAAAGFIIAPEVDISGKVDVWSNQPLTKDEAVDLLNRVLAKDGYAVLRDGRTLTILTQTEAKRRNETPVRTSYEPSTIPKDEQVVTQIIPVRFINAVQLAKDLQPLMPSQTTMTANEGGNALVLTDTQRNIHRMAEIIKALDTTVSSLSSVKVFALRYADAKTVADMVKEVFGGTDSGSGGARGGGGRGQFRFGGGGPFAAMFGGGGDSGGSNTGRPGAAKVVATADDRSNSLVVSAPDDLMPTIEQLVTSVDTSVDDVTEIRVFRLTYADPQETADQLAALFPDSSTTQNNQGGGRFGGFFRGPFGGGGGGGDTSTQSDRLKKQSKVIAVPDKRTGSVVVTAAHDTMEQIAKMITQLDADPARKKNVYIVEVPNMDPTVVQQTLQDLFSGQNTSSSRSPTANGQAGTQLSTRAQRQNQNTGTSSTRSTGMGTGMGSSSGRTFGN
jgi:general secretion pathway protein D